MLTKYQLIIGSERYDVPERDLKNWGDIKCAYKRTDIGGVVRSCSSSYEFVGGTRELLMAEYISKGVFASVKVAVFVIDNNWRWHEVFIDDLDFATLKTDDYILKINCVDNSIGALIKANKSTKYEFAIGNDITTDINYEHERLPLIESANYEFTNEDVHTTEDDHGDGSVCETFYNGVIPWVGRIGDANIVNGGVMFTNEDQKPGDDSDFLMKNAGSSPITVTIDYSLQVSRVRSSNSYCDLALVLKHGSTETVVAKLIPNGALVPIGPDYVPYYDEMPTGSKPHSESDWMVAGGWVYKGEAIQTLTPNGGAPSTPVYYWHALGKESDSAYSMTFKGKASVTLNPGATLVIKAINFTQGSTSAVRCFLAGQKMEFTWQTPGTNFVTQGFRPLTVAQHLMSKLVGDRPCEVQISDSDPRLANTFIFAAESIRAIPNAKLYTSFNSFANWMEAVFGYVYTTEESIIPAKYQHIARFDDSMVNSNGVQLSLDPYAGDVEEADICYIRSIGVFAYVNDDVAHLVWPGSDAYNVRDGHTYKARADVLFYWIESDMFCTTTGTANAQLAPATYDEADFVERSTFLVRFAHRDELFADVEPAMIASVTDVQLKVSNSYIYSAVEAGYKKQEYDSPSGRDEFNFLNTYTTGCTLNEKKLSLISDYRADSYGVEFCAQKRGKSNSDSESDSAVFFILCEYDTKAKHYKASHAAEIDGVLSDKVFNGAFNPVACVNANKKYIATLKGGEDLHLVFASGEGNTDITIDGVSMDTDITITSALSTCAEVEFQTIDIPDGVDFTKPIRIESGGFYYTGYLMEQTIEFARNVVTKYKLLVKSIEPCQ